LVVDDEPYVCELLSRWLTVDGNEFTVAFSGEEALKELEADLFPFYSPTLSEYPTDPTSTELTKIKSATRKR
jgi:CheY-like chemotaxis protein